MSRCRIACRRLSTPPSRKLAWRASFSSTLFSRASRLSQLQLNCLFNRNPQSEVPFLSAVSKCVHLRGFNSSTQSLKMPKYSPEKDIPDLAGKVILVTGGRFLSTSLSSDEDCTSLFPRQLIKMNFLPRVLSSTTSLKNPPLP